MLGKHANCPLERFKKTKDSLVASKLSFRASQKAKRHLEIIQTVLYNVSKRQKMLGKHANCPLERLKKPKDTLTASKLSFRTPQKAKTHLEI
ncbi:hypothetical protein P9210_09755, partial [Heyndrickxia coagulans]|nr:hypothetical protein [Heyndrickxia coagulans]